jgi:pimeloyl-ACP methyl ester carboxylesterase
VSVAVDLSFSETGAGDPLVILHGLFGAKRNWASIARQLAPHRRVLTVDLRNHGESPWDDVHDYPALADDVAALLETRIGGPAAVMGHSMGGKAAMVLALARPELVERLLVVDIAPARSAGAPIDYLRAMRGLPLGSFTRRTEVDEALAHTIPEPAIRAFLTQNAVRGPAGLAWGVNLDAIERSFEAIRGFPEVPAGRSFAKPTVFMAGGKSEYVQPQHRAEIERLFPAATIEIIPEAGHWVHADAPAAFLEAVNRFLAG